IENSIFICEFHKIVYLFTPLPRSCLLKLAGIVLSVLLLRVIGVSPYYADAQTQKYLSYENKQYGFSIKYPSNWEKIEDPNSDAIVAFAPSQNTAYAVSFSANDQSIKGLNGDQI